MTREEAKAFLTDISYDLGTMGMEYLSCNDGKKMRDAIKALEQKPTTFDNSVLENLKAEILQLKTKTSFTFVNIDDVLRLIDKHMENKENEKEN